MTVSVAFLAGALSAGVVYTVLRRADRLGLVQRANQRSSHTEPTPTGGGLGIVAGTIVGGILVGHGDRLLLLTLALASVIALVGLIDDRWPLPAKLRLATQLVVVGAFIFVSYAPDHVAGGAEGVLLLATIFSLFLAGVWWVNLFNFMDGIDGFAASQALCMLGSATALILLQNKAVLDHPLLGLMLITGAASVGFLIFNWPPARIFMGDVGSTFLGFMLFALAFFSVKEEWLSPWQWVILGSVFVIDATATLLRRIATGEKIIEAHRNHAYQRLARYWASHRAVTLILIGVNILIMFPLALILGFFA